MGEANSKRAPANSSAPSMAAGDMKPDDYNSLQRRCAPKGLQIDHIPKLQASSPVAAPPAEQPGRPKPQLSHVATNSGALAAAPLAQSPQPMQRYAGSAKLSQGYALPRSDSMTLIGAPPPAGAFLSPRPTTQPQGMQRSPSHYLTSPQPAAIAQMQRSPSMIRTARQQDMLLATNVPAFQRSPSMIRTSQEQERVAMQAAVAGQLQRSNSMVRISAEMPQGPPQFMMAQSPRGFRTSTQAASVKIPLNTQTPSSVVMPQKVAPTTQTPSSVVLPQKVAPSTQTPSSVVLPVNQPAAMTQAGAQYRWHPPHAPGEPRQQPHGYFSSRQPMPMQATMATSPHIRFAKS
jgi:hypothetical protein